MQNSKCKVQNDNVKFKIEFEDGFSLLEVIIAIFIIIIGLVGALTLVSYTFSAASLSSSKLVAAQLAQEGIEAVRNIRDYRYSLDNTWDNWHASPGSGDYLVQYNGTSLRTFSDTFLRCDAASGFCVYNYDSGNSAPFKRKITITKISDAQIKVVSRVSWTERGRPQVLTAEDRLWNWR